MKVLIHDSQHGKKLPAKVISITAIFEHSGNKIIQRSMDKVSLENNNTETVSDSSDLPSYSRQIDGQWYGLDRELNKVTKGFDTHKQLKNEYNVISVKGIDTDDGKIYGLIIEPTGGNSES